MKELILKDKRDAAVRRFHPWVFSGAVAKKKGNPQDGEWVKVLSAQGEVVGMGHYHDGSICVRLLSFQDQEINAEFWAAKIQKAYHYRQVLDLDDKDQTNCFRLIHAEGDGLPGLIIDFYNGVAVMQCHSIGMHRDREAIVAALQVVLGKKLKAVYDKSAESLPGNYGATFKNEYVFGQATPGEVKEHGKRFWVDWESGQKTGFFLDQRENRRLLGQYVDGKKVLNAFCYTGGFSIYALEAGAKMVHSVDVSAKAMELTDKNVALNEFSADQHVSYTADVMKFLDQQEAGVYDVMVVDPPAFAKSMEKRHNAVKGYMRLNALALKKISPGGILFTFSCSQVVNKQLFYDSIVAAAIEAGRQIRVMHQLSQPADHPVSLFHPEGEYLKGLVVYVE